MTSESSGSTSLLDRALTYAGRGWQVFPLHNMEPGGRCSCGTRCELRNMSPGKHPRTKHGFQDATTDPETIRAWWEKWPSANIGIATGEVSGLWVLDIDNGRSVDIGGGSLVPLGDHSLKIIEDENDLLPWTLAQITGSGGRHYLFAYPGDGIDYRNRTNLRPGIDVRANGGYIVVPPSNHASGHNYAWLDETAPLALVPDWLRDMARAKTAEAGGDARGVNDILAGGKIEKGNRNRGLFELGSYYRGVHGFDEKQIFGLLMVHNMEDVVDPLDTDEVRQIAANAAKQNVNPPDPVWVSQDLPLADDTVTDIDPGSDLAISLHDLMTMQIDPPEPIVEDLLDGGSGVIIAGPPNVGKSWLALDLAVAVCTGTPYLGKWNTKQGSVLIIDEEGNEWGDQQRFDMLLNGRGIGSTKDLPLYLAIGKGYKLDTNKGLTAVRRMIERYRPSLVIIDSLIRVHQGDENVSKDMAKFFEISSQLMRSTGAAFVFVHHVRKIGPLDQGIEPGELIRGSSEIRAWPSIAFVVLPGEEYMEVHNIKQRWRAKPQPFHVRLLVSADKSEAKLGYMGEVERKTVSAAGIGKKIEAVIRELWDNGEHPTADLISFKIGKSPSTTANHLKRLVAGGVIVQQPMQNSPTSARGRTPMAYYPRESPGSDASKPGPTSTTT